MNSRTNPFEELERFFERMSQQFDDSSSLWESSEWLASWDKMAIDLVERNGEFVATVDLPGFERSDIDIEVSDHTLRIEAEREQERSEGEPEKYLRRERHHESTHRSIQLPEEVDKEKVNAEMKHGVLTITLPKLEVTEPKKIEIT